MQGSLYTSEGVLQTNRKVQNVFRDKYKIQNAKRKRQTETQKHSSHRELPPKGRGSSAYPRRGRRPGGSGLHPAAAGLAPAAALIRRWLEVCIPTLGSRTFGSSTHNRKCQLFGQQRVKLTAPCISCQEPEEYLIFLVVSLQ